MKKRALISGITGQDGSYLAEFLISKNYEVHGIKRRSSSINTTRIDHIYQSPNVQDKSLHLHYGDMTDSTNLSRLVEDIQPDEVYNLAAQSHVAVSFETPEYTTLVNALGPLKLLEAIRIAGLTKSTRFYQASTSELFGWSSTKVQNELTPFYPKSPYGCSKLFGHWITINYRESYEMFACCGLLFNHESPRRGETFVSRKIAMGLVKIFLGKQGILELGNLNALRDWGHAEDYVEMQWLMLQRSEPKDFIIATGIQRSVRDFVEKACSFLGIQIEWDGEGVNEVGKVKSFSEAMAPKSRFLKEGDAIIKVNPRYFRPNEVETLLGDPSIAERELGWRPKYTFNDLVCEMVESELKANSNPI